MKFAIRKAIISDIDKIYSVLTPYSIEGVILNRTREDIEKNIDRFYVAFQRNDILGVVSYYHYSDKLNEIRSLAVQKHHYKKGIGVALVKYLTCELLRDFPKTKVFALSYHPKFFEKAGFSEVVKDTLPEKIWKDCNKCINKDDCGEIALVFSGK